MERRLVDTIGLLSNLPAKTHKLSYGVTYREVTRLLPNRTEDNCATPMRPQAIAI